MIPVIDQFFFSLSLSPEVNEFFIRCAAAGLLHEKSVRREE